MVTLHDHELFELHRRAPPRGVFWRIPCGARQRRYTSRRSCGSEASRSPVPRKRASSRSGSIRSTIWCRVPRTASPFCSVTRLIPRKRVDRLVRALGRLLPELPQARLRVVGDGPERGLLVKLTKSLRLEDKIDFLGELDRKATLQQMARSNVMALPSVMESLGAVYFEAMSLGVPVLATAGEGISAYIEHGIDGILVSSEDDEQLDSELRRLHSFPPERARSIGSAGRRRFLASGPTWRANVAASLELFDELLRKQRGGRSAARASQRSTAYAGCDIRAPSRTRWRSSHPRAGSTESCLLCAHAGWSGSRFIFPLSLPHHRIC